MGEACQVEKDETSEADKVGKGERTKGERVEESRGGKGKGEGKGGGEGEEYCDP